MGVGIVDGAIASVDATRKILICARSDPASITLPEKPLATVINASLFAAALIFIIRLTVYNYAGLAGNLSEWFKVGLDALIALTSLVPVVVISMLASLLAGVIVSNDQAETMADKWSVMFSFVWIVTLILRLVDMLLFLIAGHENVGIGYGVREIAKLFWLFGSVRFWGMTFDLGMLISSIFLALLAFVLLIVRTRYMAKQEDPQVSTPIQLRDITQTVVVRAVLIVAVGALLYFAVEAGRGKA